MCFFYDEEAGTTSFETVDEILKAAIQMKATEQFFFLSYSLLCCTRKQVILTFKYVCGTLKCVPPNENYWPVLSCGTVYFMLYKVVLSFKTGELTMKS